MASSCSRRFIGPTSAATSLASGIRSSGAPQFAARATALPAGGVSRSVAAAGAAGRVGRIASSSARRSQSNSAAAAAGAIAGSSGAIATHAAGSTAAGATAGVAGAVGAGAGAGGGASGGGIGVGSILKWTAGVIGVGLVGSGAAGTYMYQTDEGFQRSVQFWSRAFPIYARYRYTQFKVEGEPEEIQDAHFDVLHDKYADEALDIILSLKGFYIKLGQMGSSRADFLPPQFIKAMSTLQDDCPYEDFDYVQRVVEEELGRPLGEVFSDFGETPIGAASIGQVHKARLIDGTEVVVKVQYPNAEQLFRSDIKTIKAFCRLAQPAHLSYINEIEKQFLTEFDYRLEAEHLENVADNMAASPYADKVVVPRPLHDLCTPKVLVMDYLPGIKLMTGLKRMMTKLASEEGISVDEFMERERAKFEAGELPQAPSKTAMSFYIGLVRATNALKATGAFAYNWTLGWVTGPIVPAVEEVPFNLPAIVDLLLQVHGHEVFVDGYFNGDPHPGNILLHPDGRLGLIDYGQVKKLPAEKRLKLARLYKAIWERDSEAIIAGQLDMELKTQKMDPYVIEKFAVFGFDRDGPDVCDGLNIQLFLEELDRRDPVISMDDDYVMVSRLSFIMRGFGTMLGVRLSVADAWKDAVNSVLRDAGEPEIADRRLD